MKLPFSFILYDWIEELTSELFFKEGEVDLLGKFLKNKLIFNYQKDAAYKSGIWDPNTACTTGTIKIWVQDSSVIRVHL